MRLTSRRAAAAVAALATVAGLAQVPAASATDDFALDRVAGIDRYETAAKVAAQAFPSGADAVVLARGDAFPDALAGSYLTGVLGAPILLTKTNELPAVTKAEIDDLGAKTIYLLGGTGAISQGVEDGLKSGHTVNRVAGNDRYGTAAKIATSQNTGGIGEVDGDATAFLASGATFADALAAGPLAHAAQLPILLTAPGALPADTKSALSSLGIKHVVVLGGTAAVSEAVVSDVKSTGATTERVAGLDRYATAAKIADFALANIPEWNNDGIDLATGQGFADALAAGPSAGALMRSILLTTPDALSKPTSDWLLAHASTLLDGRVYGGTAAVSNAVVDAAEAAGQGSTGGATQGQLTFIDTTNDFYRYVPDGASKFETVDYDPTDTFTVNGVSATVGGFEAAATPADTIRYTPASGATKARHELTDVDASTIKSGTVGNVDTSATPNKEFDIINKVSGDALVENIAYAGKAYTIDGTTADESTFDDDINEGDTIAITTSGTTTTYALANTPVTGPANDITKNLPSPLTTSASFKIGQLGDDPAASSDGAPDPDGNDDVYKASANPQAGDKFVVDGDDTVSFSDFADDLSEGDRLTYTRKGGVQTFALVNTPPTTESGQAVDGITKGDSDPITTPESNDGGSFTMATDTGTVDVSYEKGGTFVVDGNVASEAEFEAAYSAGDDITYRQADTASGTTQRLEVDNRNLAGAVDKSSVHTEDQAAPGTTANSYGVLASNGETILKTVEYSGAGNTYFVNGTAVTIDAFETELNAIKSGTKTGDVEVVTSGSGNTAVTQHKLSTTAA